MCIAHGDRFKGGGGGGWEKLPHPPPSRWHSVYSYAYTHLYTHAHTHIYMPSTLFKLNKYMLFKTGLS